MTIKNSSAESINSSNTLSTIEIMDSPVFPVASSSSDIQIDHVNVNESNVEYKMYKKRWLGLFSIILLNTSTGLVWLTFSAVPQISADWMHTSLQVITYTVVIYFVAFILTSTLSGFVFQKFGVKWALIIGGILNIIGSAIRYFASFIDTSPDENVPRILVIFIGQFIAAAGQPFFLNAPPIYSAIWFSEGSRSLAVTIGTLSNPLSAAITMVVVPELCNKSDDLPFTLLIISIVAVVSILPVFIISNKPPTPPSPSAEMALEENCEVPFWIAIKKTWRNKPFWILFTTFSIFVAFFNGFATLINQYVTPYKYNDEEAGYFGAALILFGIIGAGITGVIADKTKKFQPILKVLIPFVSLSYVALIFIISKTNFVWITISCGILGFFSFALLPVALELGIEATYPCPPANSTSLLWLGGNAFAVVILFVQDLLRASKDADPPENMEKALIFVAVIACLGGIFAYFYNSPNYRMEAEERFKNEKNKINSEDVSVLT